MHLPDLAPPAEPRGAGVVVAGEPRTTGDGCSESVVLDPDGNRVELTARGRCPSYFL
jgi:hypothetical protein